MRIDNTGITYQRVPVNSGATPPAPRERAGEAAQKIDTHDEVQKPEVVSRVKPGDQASQPRASLSEHLSLEEREMIQRLFPSAGRDSGVHAYRRVSQGLHGYSVAGKQIDVKS